MLLENFSKTLQKNNDIITTMWHFHYYPAKANFSSHLYSATISSPSKADLQLVVKKAALSESFKENGLNRLFDSEYNFYTDIARTFAKIEDKHNVRGEKRMIFPKFYGCSMTFLEETLVFEDLTASNFTSYDRFKAVEKLAKFHALSLAYKKDHPAQYQKSLQDFENVLVFKKSW